MNSMDRYYPPYQPAQDDDLLNAMPDGLRDAALEMASRLGLPVDLVIINMISVIGSLYQGLFDYENLEGLARPISENIIIVGPRASGKSQTFKAIYGGLFEFGREIVQAQREVREDRKFQRELWSDKRAVLQAQHRRALDKKLPTESVVEALNRLRDEKPKDINTFRLFYEKITLAALENLVSHPGISFTVASDEGSKIAESGPLKNPGFMADAWDGSQQSNETTRQSNLHNNYRISLRLDFQPEVFHDIFLRRKSKLDEVGFVQRCLYYQLVPSDSEGARIPNRVKGEKEERFLAGLLYAARTSAYNLSEHRMKLCFSEKAKGAWPYINSRLKETGQPDGPLARMPAFQRRLMEHTERIACILHLGELMYRGSDTVGEISDITLAGASIVGQYYAQHAGRLFFPATLSQQEADASRLEDKIQLLFDSGLQYIRQNDLLRLDIVPGRKRFYAAMELISARGRYVATPMYFYGSRKPTTLIVRRGFQQASPFLPTLPPP